MKVASYREGNKEMCYGRQAQPVSHEKGNGMEMVWWKILAVKGSAIVVSGEGKVTKSPL
jgi:hypothetical protein